MAVTGTNDLSPRQAALLADLQKAMSADGETIDTQTFTPSIAGTDDSLGHYRENSASPAADPAASSAAGGEGGTAADQPSPQPSPEPDLDDLIARHTGQDDADADADLDEGDGLILIDDDADEDASAAAGGAPGGTAATPSPGAPSTGVDLGAVWESHYGHRPSVDEVVDFLSTVDSINQATPQQRALIAQVLAGYDPLVDHTGQLSPTGSPAGSPAPAATLEPASSFTPIPVDEYMDEPTRRAIEATNAQLAQMAARQADIERYTAEQQQVQAQAALEARNQFVMAGVQRGREAFYAEHEGFTDTQRVLIERKIRSDPRLVAMLQLHPQTGMPMADVEDVAKKAYALIVSETPELAAVTTANAQAVAEQAEKTAQRKRKSTSISGRSAAIPGDKVRGGRRAGWDGLRAELEEAFAQGGQSE